MPDRLIAIGDIHGCCLALDALIEAIEPGPSDIVVTLGDYVDRGLDSKGVIDRLIGLRDRCKVVCLKGNHEQMMLEAIDDDGKPIARRFRSWLEFGGIATLASYGESPDDIPAEHLAFLKSCADVFEAETHFFVHASYVPNLPFDEQPTDCTRWDSIRHAVPAPHVSGKIAVVGHTSQKSGEVLDLGHLVCIDTHCYGGGWLSALDVRSGQVWQANESGKLRL